MEKTEKEQFAAALEEAAKLLELAQTKLQRARSAAPEEFFIRADILTKRVFELKVKADWLRHLSLGKISFSDRQSSDRRYGVDRRLVRMQKVLLSVV
jgi:hypothetical protein